MKRQVGSRLAQAAWSLVYNNPTVAWTGPVISGCEVSGSQVRVKFNSTLLKGGAVDVRDYNKTDKASVMWVLTTPVPGDADKNYAYPNREQWWGDSSAWTNVNFAADPADKTSVVITLPTGTGITASKITAIKCKHATHPPPQHVSGDASERLRVA